MTNLVKFRYSHAYKCEKFLNSGEIVSIFCEQELELNPQQRQILVDSIPVQNSIINGNNVLDFSGIIYTYEKPDGKTANFTYELTSDNLFTQMLTLTNHLENFKQNMKENLETPEKIAEKKVKDNRDMYLNHPEKCKELEWINPEFFDDETIEFIHKCKNSNH